MSMMILKIDENTEFDVMGKELQDAIIRAGVRWPESRLLSTKPVDGKQLILINAVVDGETLERWMNVEYPTNEVNEFGQREKVAFNLGWEVLAEEGQIVDQSLLIPFYIGNPADLTGKLQTWSGKNWAYSEDQLPKTNGFIPEGENG